MQYEGTRGGNGVGRRLEGGGNGGERMWERGREEVGRKYGGGWKEARGWGIE